MLVAIKRLDKEPFIRILHVGGRQDNIGPADKITQLLASQAEVTVCEADPDVERGGLSQQYTGQGAKLIIMPCCLHNRVGKANFYINVMPDCSSLRKIHPDAAGYTRDTMVWGEICRPARSIVVNVTTIDELYNRQEINLPDFLSLDAQGVEYEILEGASKALQGDLVGIVTEVQFSQVYDGQKLFTDQDILLRQHRFRLATLYNSEFWYADPSCTMGQAFLITAEALYLRDFRYFTERSGPPPFIQLARLIVATVSFGLFSYAYIILKYIEGRWPGEWNIFKKEHIWFCDAAAFKKGDK